MQQFSEFAIGRSDLLNSTDVHIELVIVKIGDLVLGHQEFLLNRRQTLGNLNRSEANVAARRARLAA